MRAAGLLALAVLLALPQGHAQGGRDAFALALAEDVSGRAIHGDIAALTQDPATGYRMVGTASHDAARDWVAGRFAALGLEPKSFEHGCTIRNAPNPTGLVLPVGAPLPEPVEVPATSVLALVEGRSRSEWVLVGGHYDTREDTVGALDNAAGTAMVLELARAFAARRGALERSVLFVAWDCEEWGLRGSRAFVERLPQVEALFGLANGTLALRMAVALDMPGLNWPAADTWGTYHKGEFSVMHVRTSPIDTFGYYNATNYTAEQLQAFRDYRAMVKHAAYDLLGYPVRWVWVEDDTHGRSDHVPFIAAGIPGMRVHGPSDEEYPPYHKPADTLPAADASAGGEERFVAGLESAARLTGVAAALAALPQEPGGPGDGAGPAGPPRAAPGPEFLVAVAALALAGLARRARAGMGGNSSGP